MLPKISAKMPALKESHIVRIAVELENQTAQLLKFDSRRPLTGKLTNSFSNFDPEKC